MSGRLEGKTALITAAGQGIGQASAIAMAREGARVYATDVKPHLLEAYSGMPNVVTRALDVLDDAAIAHLADELPALDILFNCAGYVHNGTILDCEPKDWDFSFNLNVRAMYVTIRSTLPKMLAKVESTGRGTSIINMASIAFQCEGTAQSLRVRRVQSGRDRPHQAIAADFVTKAFAATRSVPARSTRPRLPTASTRIPIRSKRGRCSSGGSRWGDSRKRRRLRRSSCSSRPTRPRSLQETCIPATAA
jgi:2-keto-3-deoxy-L-fuconate dehydrogenase